MEHQLTIYNTMTRQKELFVPLNEPFVGMYVCGPTVYGDAHLGHARPGICFDLLFRYLTYLGYKVRYVRNITDVGHLVNDADEGEDKIGRKAKLEQLEPMEIVQRYTLSYHRNMAQLNLLPPSIEPHASGHIIEQQEMVQTLLDKGFAYESDGSIYFDVEKFNDKYGYGRLSGRKIDELLSNTRDLSGQGEKRSPLDFALWKKAAPEHIMWWRSPWGKGFPGWHLECSCMSRKYLGEQFDIHGGGLDLQFPHHECEIAQSTAAFGVQPVRYWMHNNMVTINGQKMGKSLGNFITLDQLFTGNHPLLEEAYSPMTIRFFILQAHYRSPLDFSNEALQAAAKGYERLMSAVALLDTLTESPAGTIEVEPLKRACEEALNDDLNTPILIAHLFNGVKWINSVHNHEATIDHQNLEMLKALFHSMVEDILGLLPQESNNEKAHLDRVIALLMSLRQDARKNKDWATSDRIRDELKAAGIIIKDTRDGYEWTLE